MRVPGELGPRVPDRLGRKYNREIGVKWIKARWVCNTNLGSSRSGAVSSFDVRSCKQPLGPSHLIRRPVWIMDHGVK